MTRLGVLGGTFDPVHLGHIASAQHTAAAFDLERVLLILSARPPHKPTAVPASTEDRLAMLELAAQHDPLFEVSDMEVRRDGPSYTYDTLAELRRLDPAAELFLILGVDAYDLIDTWYRAEALLELANVIVTTRPGEREPHGAPLPPVAARAACCYDPDIGCYVHQSGHVLHSHPIEGLDISASQVRETALRELDLGRPPAARIDRLAQLTGPAVAAHIVGRNLYAARRPRTLRP